MGAPATLPANFFSKQQGPPATLPADFFSAKEQVTTPEKPGFGAGLREGSTVAKLLTTAPTEKGGILDTLGELSGFNGFRDATTKLSQGDIKGAAGAFISAADTIPVRMLKGQVATTYQRLKQAKEAYSKGEYQQAIEHVGGAVPAIGPAVEGAFKIAHNLGENAAKSELGEPTDFSESAHGAGMVAGTALDAAVAKGVTKLGKPGVPSMVAGAVETAGGGAAALAGHPGYGGMLAADGAARVARGFGKYQASKVPPPLPPPPAPTLADIRAELGARIDASLKPFEAIPPDLPKEAVPPPLPRASVTPAVPAPPEAAAPVEQFQPPTGTKWGTMGMADVAKAYEAMKARRVGAPEPQAATEPQAPAAALAQELTGSPEGGTIPAKPTPSAEVFKQNARNSRAPKVAALAKHLNDAGISAEDVKLIPKVKWRDISDALGIELPKELAATTRDVEKALTELQNTKKPAPVVFMPSADAMKSLQKPGAMEAARKFAEAMGQ